MQVISSFAKGVGTANKKSKMLVYLWLANFVFALLVVTPLFFLFQKHFSRSLMQARFGQGFDMLWLGDVLYKFREVGPAVLGSFLAPALLYFLVYIFLNGGILGRIAAHGEKVELSGFLSDCGKYFFRFFRVFLISIAGYAIVFAGLMKLVGIPLNAWTENASSEWPLIFSANIRFLVLILLFSSVRMFFDYVRVRLVVEDSRKTVKATIKTFGFLGKRFFKAWFLYLWVGLVLVFFLIVFTIVFRTIPKQGFLFVIAFLWQQAYILSRLWTRLLFFSTEYHFYRMNTEIPAANPEEDQIPSLSG